MVIKSIRPLSLAKLSALLYAVLGLLVGAVFSVLAMVGGFASDSSHGSGIAAAMGIGGVIFFPILYGTMGFVASLVGAWLYNIAAGIMGGIELDVQPGSVEKIS